MYNIDWIRKITEALQFDVRMPVWINWIYALIKPVRRLADDFAVLRAEIYEENRWNGTKASLEKVLNNRYDPILRRIQVLHVNKEPVLFYQGGAEQPDVYYTSGAEQPVFYYRGAEDANDMTLQAYELKIRVHNAISFIPEELFALIDVYRYAGLRPKLFRYGIGQEVPVEDQQVEIGYE